MLSQGKTTRRCSVCSTQGHTKRTCILSRVQKRKKRMHNGVINLLSHGVVSPHVVDLKEGKEQAAYAHIPVFKEKRERTGRAIIDFATMVRHGRGENTSGINRQRNMVIPQGKKEPKKKKTLFFSRYSLKQFFQSKRFRGEHRIRPKLQWTFSFTPKILAYRFVVFLLILALPFPAVSYYKSVEETSSRVVDAGTGGFLALQSSTVAALHADLSAAQADLDDALFAFSTANSIIEQEHRSLQYVVSLLPVIGAHVKSRQHILVAGHHLSLGNTYLIKGIDEANRDTNIHLTDRLNLLTAHLRGALPQYEEALLEMKQVDKKTIPISYQQSFEDFQLLFGTFVDDIRDVIGLSDAISLVFGSEDFKRYLVVFQNNRELRATGGFMGSYAVVDVQKGRIRNIDVPGGGTYDIQGALDVYVKPPTPLQLINKRWEFQDANWWPDFPTSAKKIEWFYEHGKGSTVDGVIAINASVLERLLAVVGSIENADYGVLLDAENALNVLEYEVEVDYDKQENQPKAILASVLDQFLGSLNTLNTVDVIRFLTELHEALEQREIQVYANDPFVQKTFNSFGWTGNIISSSDQQDYLMIANTNISGGKSDALIEQTIEHQAVVGDTGLVTDTVVIRRAHTGNGTELLKGSNVDYVRVYVPQGAQLIEAGGFLYPPEEHFLVPEDWYEEDKDLATIEKEQGVHIKSGTRVVHQFGKTVFGNWMITNPGETSEAYLVYQLPFSVFDASLHAAAPTWKNSFLSFVKRPASRYSLFIQKQSGVNGHFSSTIIYPEGWSPVWRSDEEIELARNGGVTQEELVEDRIIGVVMEKGAM